MAVPITLWQLDAKELTRAASALEGLHPAEEETLRALFAERGGDFAAFWATGPTTWARDLMVRDKPVVREVLRRALAALAGRRAWRFEEGIAAAVHAVVGVDPERLDGLYPLSGGPPRAALGSDAAVMFDTTHEQRFDVLLPDRFAPERGERGLAGAWSDMALADVRELVETIGSRAVVDAALAARGQSIWSRLRGDASRAARIREELDAGAWATWERIAEAVRVTHAAGACLGYEVG